MSVFVEFHQAHAQYRQYKYVLEKFWDQVRGEEDARRKNMKKKKTNVFLLLGTAILYASLFTIVRGHTFLSVQGNAYWWANG